MCFFVLAMTLTFQFKQEKGYGKKKKTTQEVKNYGCF